MQVKLNWAKSLIKNKKWDVYAKMRVRIYLRKANITLTALAEAQELTKVKNKEGGKLTTEDVINALTRGDEVRYFDTAHFCPKLALIDLYGRPSTS